MNWWRHLQTFLWLNWRIRSNRRKRAAAGSIIIEWILSFLSIFSGAVTFAIGFSAGVWILPNASAPIVMLVWDGVAAGFLFFWMLELVNELQRSEALSMQKFLHLPVSLSAVFLINYAVSLFTLSTTLFFPLMTGLSAGLVVSKGPVMLLLFPVLAGFLLMVTALTYQLRGWLASLMENKRRRRTIITLLTMMVVLIFQIPNLLNFYHFNRRPSPETVKIIQQETIRLDQMLAARQIDKEEYQRQVRELQKKYGTTSVESGTARLQEVEKTATTINIFVPLGWLPYSAMALAGRKNSATVAGHAGPAPHRNSELESIVWDDLAFVHRPLQIPNAADYSHPARSQSERIIPGRTYSVHFRARFRDRACIVSLIYPGT